MTTTITDFFSKAGDVEIVPALLSLLEHIPQMRLYEEPGGVDLSEVHIEGELIDNMVVLWGRPRIYI
jgi:hypothetical protein